MDIVNRLVVPLLTHSALIENVSNNTHSDPLCFASKGGDYLESIFLFLVTEELSRTDKITSLISISVSNRHARKAPLSSLSH